MEKTMGLFGGVFGWLPYLLYGGIFVGLALVLAGLAPTTAV
jgi:hypothetical protein